ncbi:MAG TPA: sigma-70 family RNA polymerase sigma factor [Gemmata sp.]|nr:sigma-70 family RNA polymerase sigma factor [Gemmata sp.]
MTAPQVDVLVQSCWRLALALAKKFTRRYPFLQDEFESEAIFALHRAATHFDPTRGFQFITLAYVSIRRALHQYLTRERMMHPDRFRRPNPTDSEDDPLTRFASPQQPDRIELVELIEMARGATYPLDWELLTRRVRDNEKLGSLAKELSVSHQRIRQRVARASQAAREAIRGKA